MLTGDLSIVRFEDGQAHPDRLTRGRHAPYVAHAAAMLDVYRKGVGTPRHLLHRAVEAILADEPECEVRRVRALCKVLDDASEFTTDDRGAASALRLKVFGMAAAWQPVVATRAALVGTTRADAVARLEAELGRPFAEIEADLYADVISFQPLAKPPPSMEPTALLGRYNVAQAQACLYRALEMRVDAGSDFRQVLRGIKLAGLMHDVERVGVDRHRMVLTGPASVLRATSRYGIHLARVLTWLLSCADWRMEAPVKTPWGGTALFRLSSRDGLKGPLEHPEAFDSRLEEKLAERFEKGREGWTAHREAVVLHQGQHTFVPDFAFRHEDGTEVLLEIVGFWTPEYLQHKRETLQRFRSHRILLAVPESSLRPDATLEQVHAWDVIPYKSAIQPAAVLGALERVRAEKVR